MNKKTKMMLVLLSAASVTAGVIGLAGCKTNKNPSSDTQVSTVYAEYVAYATANGQEVLTYEQWLETIKTSVTIKGDDGATPSIGSNGNWFIGDTDTGVKAAGTDGAVPSIGSNGNWFIGDTDTGIKAAGKNGEDGVSIEEVSLSPDGTKLVIKYSNGEKDEVPLPEEVTHVHKYDDDNVTVLMMPTETADGLGYKKCEDDEHIELVVLKRYEVKLTLEGKPVAGVGVKINGKTAVSDDFGVAKFADFGDYNDYIVTLDTDKYEVAGTYRTGATYGADMELKLSSKLAAGNVVPGSGSYAFTFNYNSLSDEYNTTGITLTGGSTEARKYKLTSEAAFFSIKDDYSGGNELVSNGEYIAIVAPNESLTVYVTVNPYGFPWDEDLPSTASYIVKVEELVPPEIGTVKELPINVSASDKIELPANSTDWVYYSWTKDNSEIASVSFKLENAEAVFTTVTYSNWKFEYEETNVVDDAELAVARNSYAYVFRVRATGDNPSFILKANAPYGSSANPITVVTGTEAVYDFNAAGATDGMSKWFKYTCTVAGDYIIEPTKTSQITVYKGSPDGSSVANVGAGQSPIKLEAGDYYFNAYKQPVTGTEDFECGFKIRVFTDDDYGFSATFAKPVQLENGRATVTAPSGVETYYFKVTADKEGLFRLSGADSKYDAYINGTRFLTSKDVAEGDEVVIIVKGGVSVNLAVLGLDELQETHTFTVADSAGEKIDGAKVTVYDNKKDVVVAEGTTDAQGVVALDFIPGSYSVVVAKDGYYFDLTNDANRSGTNESKLDYQFTLRNDATRITMTVKSGTKLFANATITFKTSFDDKVVKTVTTDANGQVTVDLFIPSSGELKYTVELDPEEPGKDDYTYDASSCYFNSYYKPAAKTVEFTQLATYNVTVKNKDGKPVKGVTVTLTPYMNLGGQYYAMPATTAVSNENGIAAVKCNPIDSSKKIKITVSNLPEGYTDPGLDYLSPEDMNIEFILVGEATNPDPGPVDPDNPDNPDNPDKPDVPVDPEKKPVNGAASVNLAGNSIVEAGITEIVNEAETNYYLFTAAEAGTYTFLINDAANAGYISFLSYGTGNSASSFTKLIENGKEVSVACNLILGKNRGFNKAYEFTVTLRKGQSVAIGYTTATGEGGTAQLSVKNNAASTNPGENETPSVVELKEGENVITLGSKPVTVTFTVPVANGTYLVEWDNENIGFYEFWNGEPDLENPVDDVEIFITNAPEGEVVSYYIVPNGQTSVTITVSAFSGPGGY